VIFGFYAWRACPFVVPVGGLVVEEWREVALDKDVQERKNKRRHRLMVATAAAAAAVAAPRSGIERQQK
jgi:hypothetical protein